MDELDPPIDWCRAKQGTKWQRPGPEVLPAWVADMDFPVCPPVVRAIAGALERGDLGYPAWEGHPLAVPFQRRMVRRYGWEPDPGHVRAVTNLIQALEVVTELGTAPGDGVVVHVPCYPPFLSSLAKMGRRVVPCPLEPDGASWSFDPEALSRAVADSRARLLVLVNPHNPTGRVFTRTELEQLAGVARDHDLVVVADEIHAELIHAPSRHLPFAALGEDVAARTVTITSASKSFNLAGLRTALAHVGHPGVRSAWDRLPGHLLGEINVLGVEATLAAWAEGDGWLERVRLHLTAQRDHLRARLGDLPGLSFRPPEGTYLAWLDCRDSPAAADPAQWFRHHAGVELSPGSAFGPGGDGHARLNFATSRDILDQILDRMAAALRGGR